jgi:hypothetical protein
VPVHGRVLLPPLPLLLDAEPPCTPIAPANPCYGQPDASLESFKRARRAAGVKADRLTYALVCRAHALANLERLAGMYARCGSMAEVRGVFDDAEERNESS